MVKLKVISGSGAEFCEEVEEFLKEVELVNIGYTTHNTNNAFILYEVKEDGR